MVIQAQDLLRKIACDRGVARIHAAGEVRKFVDSDSADGRRKPEHVLRAIVFEDATLRSSRAPWGHVHPRVVPLWFRAWAMSIPTIVHSTGTRSMSCAAARWRVRGRIVVDVEFCSPARVRAR